MLKSNDIFNENFRSHAEKDEFYNLLPLTKELESIKCISESLYEVRGFDFCYFEEFTRVLMEQNESRVSMLAMIEKTQSQLMDHLKCAFEGFSAWAAT